MEKTDKIYVAGHRGLVGSAIVRSLKRQGYESVIGKSHKELDLTEQAAVRAFFEEERPDIVVLAAAKVGGINANNTSPADFAYENMQIQCNVIKCCHDYGVKKLLFLGSTCIYPKLAPQPIPEDALLTESLPYTVERIEESDGSVFIVEGPKIEKMLGYTNLDSEKGFAFFQRFLKESGILKDLEAQGISEGDTVRMYGLEFDYFK